MVGSIFRASPAVPIALRKREREKMIALLITHGVMHLVDDELFYVIRRPYPLLKEEIYI